jgi:uncharacterized damage-inducible protein DinB
VQRDAIQELFEYTGWAWQRIERVIDGLPEGTFARAVEGSGWPSLAACVTHFTAAYDGWLNGGWSLALGELKYPGGEALTGWATMKPYRAECREMFRNALAVDDATLYAKRRFDLDGGPEMLSRAAVITNLVLHERGHHGDLNTLFHQLGVRSYIIDYRYLVSRRDEFAVDAPDE